MSNLSVNTITDASGGSTASVNGYTPQASNMQPHNLIINGAMTVAQRGTSKTATSPTTYLVDRFKAYSGDYVNYPYTISQSTDGPYGFANSLKYNFDGVDATPSVEHSFWQSIEGQNLQHLKKGTPDAESITLSFWCKSSVAGTYIAELMDGDNSNRHINKAYTINSANTWEYKTITFAGDTTGSLDNDNGASLLLTFWLSANSSNTSGTLQTSWGALNQGNRAVGQTNLAATLNNAFYITGVQLEAGSTASSFAHENVGDTLRKCQRYYRKLSNAADPYKNFAIGRADTGNNASMFVDFIVPMRAVPTITLTSLFTDDGYATNGATIGALYLTNEGGGFNVSSSSVGGGRAVVLRANGSSSASLQYSAEL